ncbi:MAG: hypothetical protein KBT03_08310 [Bacteroidales bacterium]|nr:hypothetical protein [Candidatus Scybalousia scybalohippi]
MATVKTSRFDFAKPEINESQGQLANFDAPIEPPKTESQVKLAKKTRKGEIIGKHDKIALSVKVTKEEWEEWTNHFKIEMRSLSKGIENAVNEYIKAKKTGKI